MSDTITQTIAEYLGGIDTKPRAWDRKAHPTIYALSNAYVAMGKYPYNADVEAYIKAELGLPDEVDRPLEIEVYLASRMRHADEHVARFDKLTGEGWLPITDFEPVAGQRIRVNIIDAPWLKASRLNTHGGMSWVLMKPRARSNGYDLAGMVSKHEAFERTRERGYTAMDDPTVVMYRSA